MVKKHILNTSNNDLLIFIPYFLPDHSYGGPIVSINALINTIMQNIVKNKENFEIS